MGKIISLKTARTTYSNRKAEKRATKAMQLERLVIRQAKRAAFEKTERPV